MNNKLYIIFGFVFIVVNLIWWLQLGGSSNELLENVVYLVSASLAFAASFYAIKNYGFKSLHGKALLFISAGYGCWLIGEIIWVFYELVLLIDPYPSPADLFYVAAYPLIGWGIIKELKLASINLKKTPIGILAGIAILGFVFLILVSYFEIMLAYDSSVSLIENFAILYGFGDLMLLIPSLLVLVMAWEFKGGKIFIPWIFIFLGLLCSLAADTLYAVFLEPYINGIYPYDNIDVLYVAGYLFASMGFLSMGLLIRRVQLKLKAASS